MISRPYAAIFFRFFFVSRHCFQASTDISANLKRNRLISLLFAGIVAGTCPEWWLVGGFVYVCVV